MFPRPSSGFEDGELDVHAGWVAHVKRLKLLADDLGVGRPVVVQHEVDMCSPREEQTRTKEGTACVADAQLRSVVSRTAGGDDPARRI